MPSEKPKSYSGTPGGPARGVHSSSGASASIPERGLLGGSDARLYLPTLEGNVASLENQIRHLIDAMKNLEPKVHETHNEIRHLAKSTDLEKRPTRMEFYAVFGGGIALIAIMLVIFGFYLSTTTSIK